MKVKDLSSVELKALIQEAVEKAMLDLLGDPDQGLELREGIQERLKHSLKRVQKGERGIPGGGSGEGGRASLVKDYLAEFLPEASGEFATLDKAVAQRILKKLKWLAENFADLTPEPLSGKLKGLFKLRVGSNRVFYSFDQRGPHYHRPSYRTSQGDL